MFKKLFGSLDTTQFGWSGRKLTALNLVILISASHVMFFWALKEKQEWAQKIFVHILVIDLIAVSLMLGLVTFEQILKFKSGLSDQGKGEETKPESEAS
jgi:hypothetical protein